MEEKSDFSSDFYGIDELTQKPKNSQEDSNEAVPDQPKTPINNDGQMKVATTILKKDKSLEENKVKDKEVNLSFGTVRLDSDNIPNSPPTIPEAPERPEFTQNDPVQIGKEKTFASSENPHVSLTEDYDLSATNVNVDIDYPVDNDDDTATLSEYQHSAGPTREFATPTPLITETRTEQRLFKPGVQRKPKRSRGVFDEQINSAEPAVLKKKTYNSEFVRPAQIRQIKEKVRGQNHASKPDVEENFGSDEANYEFEQTKRKEEEKLGKKFRQEERLRQGGKLTGSGPGDDEKPKLAWEAVEDIRKEHMQKELREIAANDQDGSLTSLYYLWSRIPSVNTMTKFELVEMLKERIIYEDENIMALNKPYGLAVQSGQNVKVCLTDVLGELKKHLSPTPPGLWPLQRLDKETTGAMIIAKNQSVKNYLVGRFTEKSVTKKYWCITAGVPQPEEGIVKIPLIAKKVTSRYKMVPANELDRSGHKHELGSRAAATQYKVLNTGKDCALVECVMKSGVKHQIRVHLGFGVDTPILGDHKYSDFLAFKPQRLSSGTLHALGIRSSKSRHLPMFLHAKEIVVPEYFGGRNLFIKCDLPKFFLYVLQKLKLGLP